MTEAMASTQKHVRAFLDSSLGKTKAKSERERIEQALLRACERYDRYTLRKVEWRRYAVRGKRLKSIRSQAIGVAEIWSDLDVISRDDLEARLGRERVAAIIDDLRVLAREVDHLIGNIQTTGAPKDVAEERWICDVADIYEMAFGKKASVWGTASKKGTKKGPFYELLLVTRPERMPHYGKLHPKQVTAVLKRRSLLASDEFQLTD